jgi:hypothetical protein
MAGGVAVMGWWKTAKPGDKVVCVSEPTNSQFGSHTHHPLEVGSIYEIEGVEIDPFYTKANGVGFFLRGFDDGFGANLFRPVQTKSTETGMAILKNILNGASVKEDA